MSLNLGHSEKDGWPANGAGRSSIHVLTLTPFFPSAGDEVSGCFIADSIGQLEQSGVASRVVAALPMHYRRREPDPSAPADWVRYPQIPGNLGLSSAGRWLYLRLRALEMVRRRNRETRIDLIHLIHLIHAHSALPCGQAAALLSRHLNIPFVVTVHGLDVFNTCFVGGAAVEWRRRASINVYRAASKVICISERVRRALQNGMQKDVRSTVVYNGTDTDFFSPASAATGVAAEQEILVVGNLIVDKGHELVLRAVRQLAAAFPQLHCRIIGEGPDRDRLEALTDELGIAQCVQFEGRKSRAEVAAAMRACSVFVLPSRYEGLGCVYLEAMACGKPVIACRGQGIDEVIEQGKNGWLIPSWVTPTEGCDQLAQALSALLRSPELCARLGASARETILNRLTLSQQAEHLVKIYAEAIEGAAGHSS